MEPMVEGQTMTYTTPDGRTTITLQHVRPGAYTVTTYQGTLRIEDQCGSFPTEDLGRAVARAYAVLAKAEAAPVASLTVLAEQGTPRQVRPTMSGAHLAAVTGAQHRALATAAMFGRVERSADHTVRTLKALARKGYLTLVMRPGTRYDVDHGVLTDGGLRELDRLDQAADVERQRAERRRAFAA